MIRAGGPAADRAVDVAVVGGGVIGCSVAYHAARRGASVALFEAESLGSGASGAAAGMLNAQAEAREPGPLLDLMLRSRELHRPLSEVLLQTTSVDPEHEWRGTLRVALDEGFVRQLRRTFDWQKEAGLAASWLSGEEAQELEPGLSPKARAGLYLPHDGQVEPSRLVRALALGATRHGADLFEGEPVTELLSMGGRKTGLVTGRIAGLRTSRRSVAAGSVVLAGGWSSGLLAAKLGLKLPLHPVQGETLTLREVEGSPAPLRKNVWDADCYLVPKRDGRIVVGATERPRVRDRRPTLGGVAGLSGATERLLPGLARATFERAWGGLRPTTPDQLPILGAAGEGPENLLFATGHYRNGVLLAPVTGEVISALALGERREIDLAPFSLDRFTARRRDRG